jgi:hypothetical protein
MCMGETPVRAYDQMWVSPKWFHHPPKLSTAQPDRNQQQKAIPLRMPEAVAERPPFVEAVDHRTRDRPIKNERRLPDQLAQD